MLFSDLSTGFAIFMGFCLLFACYCCFYVMKLGAYCREAVEFVQNQNKRAVSLRRMAELETNMTELLDSYTALLDSHKKLRSRIGMRKVRSDAQNGVDLPNDKNSLRQFAKSKGML